MKIDFHGGDELEGCKWIARNYVLVRGQLECDTVECNIREASEERDNNNKDDDNADNDEGGVEERVGESLEEKSDEVR